MDRARQRPLALRIASALVIAPLALAAVWYGFPWLAILVVIAAALMGWEWARLCGAGHLRPFGAVVILTALAAAITGAAGKTVPALVVALSGALLAGLAAPRQRHLPLWTMLGTVWIAVPCVAFLWIDAAAGRAAVFWLLAVVWASDIGAYAAGRTIGGPRLAPRWSPNKTWAGAAGGLAAVGAVGYAAAWAGGGSILFLVPASLALGVVAQTGDLVESFAKRHFGVKDSSALIPGHGGLLDRLDSILTAVAAQALMISLAGPGVLPWRI